MGKFTKTDLIEKVHATGETNSKAQAGKVVDAVLEAISERLEKGDTVAFLGFGTFSVKRREGYTGCNPQTGDPMPIPATKQIKFKPGKALKTRVNN